MRVARVAGLAALGALAILAATGGPTASATTLCSLNGSPCPGVEYPSGTKVDGALVSGGKSKFVTSLGTIECTTSTVTGETTSAGGEGKAVEGTIGSLAFSGCKLGETSCTATVVNLPHSASATATEKGNGTLAMKDSEGVGATVKCGLVIDCTLSTEEAKLKLTGGNPAIASAEAVPLGKLSGAKCPSEAKWSAEYELSQPKPLYVVTKPAVTRTYSSEEEFGLANPGEPNVLRAWTGDAINVANGNLVQAQTDISIGGRGPRLQVVRTYNSQLAASAEEAGVFGYGWTGSYSAHLAIDEEAETATVHQDNGSTVVFYLIEGKYFPAAWAQSTLVKEGENYIYTLPDQGKLEFNKSGLLTKVTDRHSNALTLTYKEGKLETVKDAASRTLTFTYKEGKVESVKDPMGHTVKYTYESGNLATVTLPAKETARWKFKYDASHRLTELTDGRSNTTKNEYDASDRVKAQTDALERKRTLEYKETEGVRETTITEPNSSKTVEKFNKAGEPTSVARASGTELAQTTTFEYDKLFQRTKATDANNHSTTYGYDAEGNRTSEKDANGNEAKWTFNATHDVKTATTPKGNTTTLVRNAAGDPETIERSTPGGTQKTTFKWASNGDLESETDPASRTTTYEYNSYGDRKAEKNAEGDKRTWTYNEDSYVTAEVSPRGNEEGAEASKFETKIERDAQDRPLTVTDPLGHTTKYVYDGNGNVETLTDGRENTTTYTYDKANQLTKVKAANEDIREIGYDSMGRVTSRTNGNKNTTKYERNLLGQITEVIDPLERKTVREYDAAGNLKKVKDPESRTITYTYDNGDRLTKVDYSAAATTDVAYEYDKDDNVTEMKDGTGTSKYKYDEIDRLTEVENGAKQVVKYEYNLANEQTKATYPNGKSITRVYDKAGRLEKITDWLSGETKFAYNRDSELKTTTFPSGSTHKDEYEYNNAGELTKITMKRGSETLASLTYARDKLGQVESVTQTGLPGGEKTEYVYDKKDRLTKAGATAYGYDAADNPTKLGEATLKYDKASQLEEGGGVKYSFDKLGERTKATPEEGPATTYGYDQAGNLISVERPEEGEVEAIEDTYAYDGNGLRASQTISEAKANLAWDPSGGLPLLLNDGTNSYIYGPDGAPFAQINSEEKVTYLHHDHLGSTRLLTNSTGEAKGTYTYSAYGTVSGQTGTATTPLGFNGQYRNESTGLIYLRKRVYDPNTAQFVSVDPLLAQTGEAYSYAGDNPVNWADPSGLQPPVVDWSPPPVPRQQPSVNLSIGRLILEIPNLFRLDATDIRFSWGSLPASPAPIGPPQPGIGPDWRQMPSGPPIIDVYPGSPPSIPVRPPEVSPEPPIGPPQPGIGPDWRQMPSRPPIIDVYPGSPPSIPVRPPEVSPEPPMMMPPAAPSPPGAIPIVPPPPILP
jgi:RHS repeat-associated protein